MTWTGDIGFCLFLQQESDDLVTHMSFSQSLDTMYLTFDINTLWAMMKSKPDTELPQITEQWYSCPSFDEPLSGDEWKTV